MPMRYLFQCANVCLLDFQDTHELAKDGVGRSAALEIFTHFLHHGFYGPHERSVSLTISRARRTISCPTEDHPTAFCEATQRQNSAFVMGYM